MKQPSSVISAMTVDVEDYFQVSAFAGSIPRSQWRDWESRVERNTHRLLDLFDQAGVRITCFVLGCVAEEHPGIVREIASRGHEVACHGYSHELVYRQTPAVFAEETRRSKALLEDQVQQPVIGYRAASYSITRESMWALDILAEAGFQYDSSIFPIRHDRYGVSDAPRQPYRVETPKGYRLAEFPLTTWHVWGQNVPVAGGGYFRILPYRLVEHGLRQVIEKEGTPAVFYLHPWEIDPDQPRVPGAPALSRFRHYYNLARTEKRLERLLKRFPFAPMRDVLNDAGLLDSRAGADTWAAKA